MSDIDINKWLENLKLVDKACGLIKEERKKTGNMTGIIECPKCGAPLNYQIHDYNGHIWGKCTTEGCLVWME